MRFGPPCLVSRGEDHPGRTIATDCHKVLQWGDEANRRGDNLRCVELIALTAGGVEPSDVQDPVVGGEAVAGAVGQRAVVTNALAEKLIIFLGALALTA